MEELFQLPFALYNVSEVVAEAEVPKSLFLEKYREYVRSLTADGPIPECRRLFSSVLSVTPDIFYAMEAGNGFLVKPLRPVVQMQLHHFLRSSIDGKYHPMVFGTDSVSWGIQFSYPQIFQDPKSRAFSKVADSPEFPNTALFTKIIRFFREHTAPASFVYEGVKTAVPMRLGKKCFGWINGHRQLKAKGLSIHVY